MQRKLSTSSAVHALNFHRSLIEDSARTNAYRAAIEEVVHDGDVVADIGCGTGILSMFACRAGARRVYAIEEEPVIEIARELVTANGFDDRITFIAGSSRDATLPERVDVVVTETMGNNGLDEQIAGTIAHAAVAFLKEGGTIIPRAIEVIAAPVERFQNQWSDSYDLDFSPMREHVVNLFHPLAIARSELLATPATIARVDAPAVRGSASWVVTRAGVLSGIAIWFRASLTSRITISNEPESDFHSWKQSFFPIAAQREVRAGEVVRAELQTFDGIEWMWRVDEETRTTLKGFPITLRE
jgi:protein arginine N-methyltransferase 1